MSYKTIKKKHSLDNTINFTARFSEEIHEFLKKKSQDQNRSMNLILEDLVKKYKKDLDNLLTSDDDVIS